MSYVNLPLVTLAALVVTVTSTAIAERDLCSIPNAGARAESCVAALKNIR